MLLYKISKLNWQSTSSKMERPCASEVLRHNFFTLSTPELRKIRSSVLNRKTTTKRKQQLNCSGNGHSGTSLPSTMNRECSNNGLLCNINMAPTYNVIDHNSPAGREDAESTTLGNFILVSVQNNVTVKQ